MRVLVRSTTLLLALAAAAGAQPKPTVRPADYGRFEQLGGGTALSPDGRALAFTVTRVDETSELRVQRLARDTARVRPDSARRDSVHTMRWGQAPRFSADSRWLAWSIGVSPDERRRLERERKPVRLRAGLLDLRAGTERMFDSVRALAFDASGRFLVLHAYAPDAPKGKGADLRVLDLAAGTEVTLGDVGEFAWSAAGSRLAFTVATGGAAGNGVQLWDGATGRLQGLDASDGTYRQLAWRDSGADLAVLRSVRPATKSGGRHVLLAWRGLDRQRSERMQLDSVATGLALTLEVAEHFRPRWSPDGRRIAIGLRPPTPDSAATRDSVRRADDDLPAMQLWHAADVQIVPQQQSQAQARARRTLLAVWEPAANRVTQVGSDLSESAAVLDGWQAGVERVSAPYPWGTMFGRPSHDVWTVDLATGTRRQAFDSVRYSWNSGAGRYVLAFDGRDYWTHDVRTGAQRNVTKGLPTAFADTASDTPTDVLPPHGVGGWLAGDRAVLLYDEHDVWRVAPDGSGATRLTRGTEDSLTHRVVRLDTARTIDPSAPLYLSLHGKWSQKRGYARRMPNGAIQRLALVDGYLSGLTRADSAPVYVYRAEARDDSPDLFVAGADLAAPRQVTRTNPFLADYAWTRTELVEYRNETGRRLQGVLLYPANHDPSRRYPMIVFAYEILSPQAHQFQVPNERSYYNFTAWTQQGYFVLLPDVVFRKRDPGVSLLETLRPAVRGIVDRGLVDEKRVGFIGHSWGGYHAAYVATHSEMFAASVAGAPLTDFVSFMGQIHWTPGNAETDHWETGQARMEVPYWEDPAAHHRNSPIHNVHNMKTPLLMAFGNEDGVVDWDQGTEFYNFARRAGKQMVLLVYEGENHAFTKKPNQIDYHRRILEWFGHYLKGEPAPTWITKGVALDDMEREKRRVALPNGSAPRPATAGSDSAQRP